MKKRSTLFGSKLLLFFLFFSSYFTTVAQNVAKRLDNAGLDTIPFLEYTPAGHDAPGSTRKYPLIIFLHGGGEKSDNPSTAPGAPVWKLQQYYGPSRQVAQGNKMNFTWNNQTDTFIVISPMCRSTIRTGIYKGDPVGIWPTTYMTRILNYAKANLKVDTNRIYLSGHSLGGGGTWLFLSANAGNARQLAGAAPVAATHYHHNNWGAQPNGAQWVGEANLPVWGFHAQDDLVTFPIGTTVPVNAINDRIPAPAVKALMTIWPTGVVPSNQHNNTPPRVFDVNIPGNEYGSEGIVNIYEWFLGQNKSLPANILPTANAGSNFSVTGTTATLDGSASTDSDGLIVRYVWKLISAPTGVSLSSVSLTDRLGPNPTATASNLTTLGNYTFRLYAVDDRAAIDSTDVVVTKTTAPPGKALTFTSSGRIQTSNVTELNGTSKFTLEARFRYDSTVSGWTTIMRKMGALNDRIMLHIGPGDNAIYVMVGNGTDARARTANNAIVPGNWYHVAAVYDGTQSDTANRVKIYINGVQQSITFPNGAIPATTTTNTAPFMAGGEPSCCQLNGIDEIRVWNTALSGTTINNWKEKLLGECHPDTANLVVYWPLDNNSTPGSALPALGTTYTGNITNGTYISSDQAIDSSNCPINTGKALTFTSSGRIQTSNVTELNGISKFTLEARFRYDSTVSGWTTIMRKMGALNDRIMLHIGPGDNAIYVMVGNGTDARARTANNAIVPGNWYHVAAVYDGTQSDTANRVKIYINGVQQSITFPNGAIPATTTTNTAPFMAGGEPSCCQLNGIDEIRVWNTALSGTTINNWKEKLLGECHPDTANLVVYWPLDNNSTPGSALPALGTTYTGNVINGTYISSDQATTPSGCTSSPATLADYSEEVRSNIGNGTLYPNPARDIVKIRMNAQSSSSVTISVIDMYGKFVYKNQQSVIKGENNLSLNIASLSQGIYIVEVRDSKTILGKYKVIKR